MMTKRIVISIIIFGVSGLIMAQHAFLDAVELRACLNPEFNQNGKTIASFRQDEFFTNHCFPILVNYANLQSEQFSNSDFFDAFFRNPFLSDNQGEVLVLIPNVPQANNLSSIPAGKRESQPRSGFFVTNLADGLAKFLVKRTKEELTIAFFRRFSNQLREHPHLKMLFPSTVELLEVIDTEIYQFNAYLEAMRERFIMDMKVLPTHAADYLRNADLIPEVHRQIIVQDALQTAQMLIDGENPVRLIQYLGRQADCQDPHLLNSILDSTVQARFKDMAAGFRLADLISESFRDNRPDQTWVGSDQVLKAFHDPVTLFIYLGLIWQKSGGIDFQSGQSVRGGLDTIALAANKANEFKRYVERFINYGESIMVTLDSLKARRQRDELEFRDFYGLVHPLAGIFQTSSEFKSNFLGIDDPPDGESNKLISTMRNLQSLQYNVRQNHYVSAVGNLAAILSEVLEQKFDFKAIFLKYGHFIASVAEARTSDEVAQAIELFALPPGSSALKKQSQFSVALNAYTGLSGGSEQLEGMGSSGLIAVSAPLGFNFNKGFANKGSLSLYVPIIDVGALAAFRFGDPDTEDLPELNFQNILSPGGYLIYGFGSDLPLSIGTGVQLGPGLRKVTDSGQFQIGEVSGWRWSVFLGVDIPVMHLYTK